MLSLLPCFLSNPSIHAMPYLHARKDPLPPFFHACFSDFPTSSIKTVKLDKLYHRLDDIILLDIQRRILDLHCDQLINQPSQPRHQNTDTGPSAEAQPAINYETTALCIQVNGTREEEEGVGVESYLRCQ